MAMGQNPNRAPSEDPIQNGFDSHSQMAKDPEIWRQKTNNQPLVPRVFC